MIFWVDKNSKRYNKLILHPGTSLVVARADILILFFSLNGEALKHAIITGDIKLLNTDETDLVTENINRLNLGIPVITENLNAPQDHHRMENETSFEKSAIPIDRRLPSDKMALIYTSGTTGYPKPAIYSYGANLWAGSLGIMLQWDDTSTVFTGCPMFHTLGSMMSCTGALWNEASFAFQPTFSASSFIKDAAKFEATTFSYIGEMMRFVANTPETNYDKSHKIKSAFGPGLRPDIWNRMHEKYGNIHFAELYGSSEGIVGLYNIGKNLYDMSATIWVLKLKIQIRMTRDLYVGIHQHYKK